MHILQLNSKTTKRLKYLVNFFFMSLFYQMFCIHGRVDCDA